MSGPAINLNAIEARANAATPGPWYQGRDDRRYEDSGHAFTHEDMNHSDSYDVFPDAANPEDAEFVAHARTDVPALVATLRRLDAALTELAHHGDLTPAGKRKLEQIIGGEQ